MKGEDLFCLHDQVDIEERASDPSPRELKSMEFLMVARELG